MPVVLGLFAGFAVFFTVMLIGEDEPQTEPKRRPEPILDVVEEYGWWD